jgi:UDP-N-acetylglucosamine 3-dehydrogenase
MTRVAVIGVGSMGKNHVRVYSEMPNVELVAVVDANPELANRIGHAYHVPAYQDYFEMVDHTKPEAVSIAVPTSLHYQVAKDILELGCHVIVEKPIASTAEQAQYLVSLADQLGVILMVGHIERYNPAIIELKRRLDQNELGHIFQIHARRLGPFPTRIQDVGVIMDLAPHDLDIMRYLTGQEVTRVHAETERILHETQDDMFAGLVRFENGILGVLEINWLTPTKIRELYVTGERGMFRVDYITQDLCFYENAETNGDRWSTISLLRGVSEGMIIRYPIKKKEPLRAELEAFISSVQGKSLFKGNGYDAQVALELVSALIQASTDGTANQVNYLLKPEMSV